MRALIALCADAHTVLWRAKAELGWVAELGLTRTQVSSNWFLASSLSAALVPLAGKGISAIAAKDIAAGELLVVCRSQLKKVAPCAPGPVAPLAR